VITLQLTRPASIVRGAATVQVPIPLAHSACAGVYHTTVGEAALASVMHTVPLGAAVLAGTMVALLVLGYLLIYTLVFIPRGTIG